MMMIEKWSSNQPLIYFLRCLFFAQVLAHSTSSYFLHEDFLGFMIDQFAPMKEM